MLLDGQAFECLDRGLRRMLGLQVGLEGVNVAIEPLQILFFDRGEGDSTTRTSLKTTFEAFGDGTVQDLKLPQSQTLIDIPERIFLYKNFNVFDALSRGL